MADMGGLEADHIGTEFGKPQPQRNLAAEHAAFAVVASAADALAGDHQGEAHAVVLRPPQEADERGVRLALGLAVQVDARLDACVPRLSRALRRRSSGASGAGAGGGWVAATWGAVAVRAGALADGLCAAGGAEGTAAADTADGLRSGVTERVTRAQSA